MSETTRLTPEREIVIPYVERSLRDRGYTADADLVRDMKAELDITRNELDATRDRLAAFTRLAGTCRRYWCAACFDDDAAGSACTASCLCCRCERPKADHDALAALFAETPTEDV